MTTLCQAFNYAHLSCVIISLRGRQGLAVGYKLGAMTSRTLVPAVVIPDKSVDMMKTAANGAGRSV